MNNILDGWKEYRLEEILDFEQPTPYIVKSTNYDNSYDTPVLTAGKSFIIGKTNETNGIYKNLPVIIFDDFTTATQFVNFPFKVKSSAMKILTAKKDLIIPKFAYYRMQIIKFDTSTHKRYWIQQYSKQIITLPSISEQQRIVAKIEDLFSKLDAGIESLKKAKQQLAVYRQAVLKEALNGKNAWGKIQADDCVEDEDYSLAIGPFGSDLKVDDYTESGVRLVFVRDVTSCFADKKNKFVSEIKANQLEAHNVFQGDLLITKMGDPPGQTAIYPFERGVITSDILRMKVNENVINKYFAMYYILSPEGKQQIKSMTQGVAQKKISLGRFKKFMFSVPELTEQSSIVSQIESRLSVCDQIERTVNESLEKADVLRQSILKKAFEGGL